MRNLRTRLGRLERVPGDPGVHESIVPAGPLSDDEEADRIGEFLWFGIAIDKRHQRLRPGSPSRSPAQRAWDEAAEEAWAAGHREYHVSIRPYAMAVWLEWKSDILKHRQSHGVWIPTGESVQADTLTPEEFDMLPVEERIAVLREHRPGYWSKHGPPSGARM
jgi:hypothetical protein